MDIITTFSQKDPHAPSEYHQYFWFRDGNNMSFNGHPTKTSINDFCYFIRAGYVIGRAEIVDIQDVKDSFEFYDGGEVKSNG